MSSAGSEDFSITVPVYPDRFLVTVFLSSMFHTIEIQEHSLFDQLLNLKVKGVPYLGGLTTEDPPWIDTFKWETVCVAYSEDSHTVALAFRNMSLLEREDEELLATASLAGSFQAAIRCIYILFVQTTLLVRCCWERRMRSMDSWETSPTSTCGARRWRPRTWIG